MGKLLYDFENAASLDELKAQADRRIADGWIPASEPREVSVRTGFSRCELRYSQAFQKTIGDENKTPPPICSPEETEQKELHGSRVILFFPRSSSN